MYKVNLVLVEGADQKKHKARSVYKMAEGAVHLGRGRGRDRAAAEKWHPCVMFHPTALACSASPVSPTQCVAPPRVAEGQGKQMEAEDGARCAKCHGERKLKTRGCSV